MRKLTTAWLPLVTSVSLPVATIKRPDIRFAFLDVNHRDAATVSRPHGKVTGAATRCDVVARQTAADIEIKISREISWFRVVVEVHYPEIGLCVGAYGLAGLRDKSDLFPVGTDDKGDRAHVNRGELR